MIRSPRAAVLALALSLAAPAAARAQAPPDPASSGPLYEALARADSLLFHAAFVACDAARAIALFTDDAEFYHDLTGRSAGQKVRDDFIRLAGNCPRAQGVTRELVPGSLRVYPIHDYGAVQMGTHRFANRNGEPATVAMFVHLWHRGEGGWKLHRVISYDHRPESAAGARRE